MDFIILSAVRSNYKKSIGFVDDVNRLNVALTRAKKGVVIVGNSKTLKVSTVWSKLIMWMKS